MIVSPTYFGAVADVAALADVAHDRGVPLIVDEAWGAQMTFSDRLPAQRPRRAAPTRSSPRPTRSSARSRQSAILHLSDSGRIDEAIVDRAVTLVESTSPNALLAASLDAARRQAAVHGAELLEESVDSLAELREEIRSIPGLDVLDERLVGSPSVHAYDPFRLVVDVRATGATGHRIATLLHDLADINLELFSENVIVAVFGIGERAARTGARLVAGLRLAIERLGEEEEEPQEPFAVPPAWGPMERTPREAFLAAQEVVPFETAEGRIAAESLAAYPPGRAQRPSRRAPDPRDARLHRRLDRPRRAGARGERPRTLKTIRVVHRVTEAWGAGLGVRRSA